MLIGKESYIIKLVLENPYPSRTTEELFFEDFIELNNYLSENANSDISSYPDIRAYWTFVKEKRNPNEEPKQSPVWFTIEPYGTFLVED